MDHAGDARGTRGERALSRSYAPPAARRAGRARRFGAPSRRSRQARVIARASPGARAAAGARDELLPRTPNRHRSSRTTQRGLAATNRRRLPARSDRAAERGLVAADRRRLPARSDRARGRLAALDVEPVGQGAARDAGDGLRQHLRHVLRRLNSAARCGPAWRHRRIPAGAIDAQPAAPVIPVAVATHGATRSSHVLARFMADRGVALRIGRITRTRLRGWMCRTLSALQLGANGATRARDHSLRALKTGLTRQSPLE